MGIRRMIDTDLWRQPWFETMTTNAKLLYIYAFSNPATNAAGFCKVSLPRLAFEMGMAENEVRAALGELRGRVVFLESEGLLWAKGFLDHQAQNGKFLMSAATALVAIVNDPSIIREWVTYQTTQTTIPARFPDGWHSALATCKVATDTVSVP